MEQTELNDITRQFRVPYDLLDDDKYWVIQNLPDFLYKIATCINKPRKEDYNIQASYINGMDIQMNINHQKHFNSYTVMIKKGDEVIEFTPILLSNPINTKLGFDTLIEVKMFNLMDYIINCIRIKDFQKTVQEYNGLKKDFDEFVKYTDDRILFNKSVIIAMIKRLDNRIFGLEEQVKNKQVNKKQSVFKKLFKRGE